MKRTFRYSERTGKGEAWMMCRLPEDTPRMAIWVPARLETHLLRATGGAQWTQVIAPLADYALDRLRGGIVITPASDEAEMFGRGGRQITIAGKFQGCVPELRKRVKIPRDVRARVERRAPEASVSAAISMLAHYTLLDLRARNRMLMIERG